MARVSVSLTAALALAMLVAACDKDAGEGAQESKASAPAAAPEPFFDPALAGEAMPAASLADPEGRTLDLASLKGTPVLLNLWATWCAPCVKEMPLLDDLAADYDVRLKVVTVSEDMGDGKKVADFFARRDLPHLTRWMDPEGDLLMALGAQSLPATIFYDADGKEVWRVIGDMDWSAEEQRAAIDEALGSGKPAT